MLQTPSGHVLDLSKIQEFTCHWSFTILSGGLNISEGVLHKTAQLPLTVQSSNFEEEDKIISDA